MQINAPIENLLGNVLELKNDINEIQDYLDPASDVSELPLGAMGRIMAQQLYAESSVLAFHAAQLTVKKHTELELARHSSVLKNKVALLSTFAKMISQLAASDYKIQKTSEKLCLRVIQRCQELEKAVAVVISGAVVKRQTQRV